MRTFLRNILARRIIRRRIAARVLACFDGVDLTGHRFIVGGQALSSGGADQFYSRPEVDKAIGRINELMAELRQ